MQQFTDFILIEPSDRLPWDLGKRMKSLLSADVFSAGGIHYRYGLKLYKNEPLYYVLVEWSKKQIVRVCEMGPSDNLYEMVEKQKKYLTAKEFIDRGLVQLRATQIYERPVTDIPLVVRKLFPDPESKSMDGLPIGKKIEYQYYPLFGWQFERVTETICLVDTELERYSID
ncbi:hypothetical protein QNI16_09925 [Cytophagaceae bacterium YF14B1]|uniref:Uncharacterized protein n=1 Tax=Xanthocytophaga flava TaxID=3048013 RepID=A0AAE3U8L1_9BACT|nr:hypothetical protein [Xanthocytophaga flavus]MDJ1480799.1 hypothetical protein [Xanthocytophaga flavus]